MSATVTAVTEPHTVFALFDRATEAITAITALDLSDADPAVLLKATTRAEHLARSLAAANGALLAAAHTQKVWETSGHKDLRGVIQHTTGGSPARVTADVRLAQASDPTTGIPAAHHALATGQITQEHVTTIAKMANTPNLRRQLTDPTHGAAALVEAAKTQPVGRFGTTVHTWRNTYAPAAADTDAKQVHKDEFLHWSPDPKNPGQSILRGRLSTLTCTRADDVLTHLMGRRPLGDERSPDARRADAFATGIHHLAQGTHPHTPTDTDTDVGSGIGGGGGVVADAHTPTSTSSGPTPSRGGVNLVVTVSLDSLTAHARAAGIPVLTPTDLTPTDTDADVGTGTGVMKARPQSGSSRFTVPAGLPHLRLPTGQPLSIPTGPHVPLPDPALPNSSAPERVADARARTQELLTAIRDYTPGGPHIISTTIDHDALAGVPPPTLADQSPLAPWEFARLTCDAQLSRVIFGPTSIVLDAGRSRRLYSPGQHKAAIARDRHCQFPGCTAPPKYLELHHSMHWFLHRGPTDIELAIAVCFWHHDVIHRDEISIVRYDGKWSFYARDGEPLTPTTHGYDPGTALDAGPAEDWQRPSQKDERLIAAPDFVPKPDEDASTH